MSDRDLWAIEGCKWIASRSKDPSTKVGAVVLRPDGTIAAGGYNGFPRGVIDAEHLLADREEKYPRTIHAELNAILTAKERLDGCTIYVWPLHPCSQCAGAIIQAGIARVVYATDERDSARWSSSFTIAEEMLLQAGVRVEKIDV